MAYTTIDDPSAYFQTKLYTGTGSSLALTNDGNSDLQPDWVWIKERNGATNQMLTDSVRGATKTLHSQNTDTESTDAQALKSFNSDGFTVGTDGDVNTSSDTYVAWNWKKTADAGFDIVSYTGNGSARTISHSLSAVPGWIIVKNRDEGESWPIYHHKNTSAPATDYLALNDTHATTDSNTRWNDTAPTSSVFTVGTSDVVNKNTIKYIAYLFAEKQGYSKFGSYAANESVDGTFVYTGFKPAFVILKQSNLARDWHMFDNKRSTFNAVGRYLRPNVSGAEDSGEDYLDLLSNGFKLKNTGNRFNDADGTYIFMAFAESPFVTSTGIPTTAR
jgi:hypothetical protein